ncbi:hypothetical protein [Microcella sp.]|uniref:hypothetical protein n=1 Tax=Microcella sp. TaxID=1913979 RepID=UPI00391D58E1
MTAVTTQDGPRIVVELNCDLCPAQVVHTDTVPLAVVTAYLSAAGWQIASEAPAASQIVACPRCAQVGGRR